MNYHPIQKQILTKFLTRPELRYSEVRIPEIENDLFNYHLQYLVKIGILRKIDLTYSISTKGLTDLLMFDSLGNVYQGLRVSVLIYIIDFNSKPQRIVAQKHIRQPYMGDFNAGITGKVRPGEPIEAAAMRKIKEETGLHGTAKLLGVIRKIRRSKDNSFLDDGLFHVCVCTDFSGDLITSNEFGENSWISFKQALELEKAATSTGRKSYAMLQKIMKQDFTQFYIEEEISYPVTSPH
jgi:8-oxo-dGTP pyrophosphatase MutT (NUDIX family)